MTLKQALSPGPERRRGEQRAVMVLKEGARVRARSLLQGKGEQRRERNEKRAGQGRRQGMLRHQQYSSFSRTNINT